MEVFLFSPLKLAIRTWFRNCPQDLRLLQCLWVHPRFKWSKNDAGSPKSTSLLSTFHIGSIFIFPANFMSVTYTDKNNPFPRCTIKHSQLETFSQPNFNKTFSTCLSHDSPPKGGPYIFRSTRTIGSSILEHDYSQLCLGWRIQIYNIPISKHLPFLLGYKLILHQLLVLRNLAVWIWCPWLLLPSFKMLMILDL